VQMLSFFFNSGKLNSHASFHSKGCPLRVNLVKGNANLENSKNPSMNFLY